MQDELDDEQPQVMDNDFKYQLLLCHDKHGAGIEAPVYDLGWMFPAYACQMAAQIGAAADAVGLDVHEGPVTNIIEAWCDLNYRVWFIPENPALPCFEYKDDQLVPVPPKEDPR